LFGQYVRFVPTDNRNVDSSLIVCLVSAEISSDDATQQLSHRHGDRGREAAVCRAEEHRDSSAHARADYCCIVNTIFVEVCRRNVHRPPRDRGLWTC